MDRIIYNGITRKLSKSDSAISGRKIATITKPIGTWQRYKEYDHKLIFLIVVYVKFFLASKVLKNGKSIAILNEKQLKLRQAVKIGASE